MLRSRLLFLLILALNFVTDESRKVFAHQAAPSPAPLTFGDANFRIPPGWKHAEKQLGGKDVLVLVPSDFGKAEKFMIILLPGRDLGDADFQQAFEKAIQGSLATGERLVKNGETKLQKTEAGFELLVHAVVIEDASAHRTLRVFCAANPNRRFEMLVAMADSAETLKHYQGDFNQILASFTFSNAPGKATAPASESVPTASAPPALGGSSTLEKNGVAITRGLWVDTGPLVRASDGRSIGVIVNDIAYDATNHTIYISTYDMLNSDAGGIFASANGGQSWTKLLRGNTSQVVPTASTRMYALEFGERISFSNDRGRTWTRCRRPAFQGRGFTDAAAIQCIGASPGDPNVLYAGASGMGAGLYKSTDGGQTWTRPAKRYVVGGRGESLLEGLQTSVNEIAVDPQDPRILILRLSAGYVQSSDGGVTAYDCLHSGAGAGAANRESLPIRVVHGGSILINPALPNLVYLRNSMMKATELYRSDDGGRHWNPLHSIPSRFIQTLVAHPGNSQILYATTESGIYVTQDAGASWLRLQSGNAPQATGGITIPYYFNGTAFNSVATVVHQDEPLIVDPTTSHLLYGTSGLRILVGMR